MEDFLKMFFLSCSYFYSTGVQADQTKKSENFDDTNALPRKDYPPNVDRKYTIEVEAGKTMELTIIKLDIEYYDYYDGGICFYDHLTIYDGDGTLLMGRACGHPAVTDYYYNMPTLLSEKYAIGGVVQDKLPEPIKSKTNVVNLYFVTDYIIERPGWKIRWTVETGECQK